MKIDHKTRDGKRQNYINKEAAKIKISSLSSVKVDEYNSLTGTLYLLIKKEW